MPIRMAELKKKNRQDQMHTKPQSKENEYYICSQEWRLGSHFRRQLSRLDKAQYSLV